MLIQRVAFVMVLVLLCACKPDQTDILLLDYGSPATPKVEKRLNELNVRYKTISSSITIEEIKRIHPKGIILSGSPASVLDADSPKPPAEVYDLGIPILGLCYGLQLMAEQLGGQVVHCEKVEFGLIEPVKITGKCDVIPESLTNINVWYSHEDCVEALPKDFDIVAHSENTPIAIACNPKKKLYGMQFHPERFDKTPETVIILDTFVNKVVLGRNNTQADKSEHDKIFAEVEQMIASLDVEKTESLDLSSRGLHALPANISRLKNLKKLILNNNPLASLPPELGKLTNLNHLEIYTSELQALPVEIGSLSNLTYLAIYGSQITTVPASIGNLIKLETLALDNNKINNLPKEIGNLVKLNRLYLSFNQLTVLPPEITGMKNLMELKISSNSLSSIPDVIGSMVGLFALDLSKNQLTKLPDSVGSLVNLSYLNVSNNDLADLPAQLQKLSKLELVLVQGNKPLQKDPASIDILEALERAGKKVEYKAAK
jgi:GMP synthase (glutamine-hydrolysing) A subunit